MNWLDIGVKVALTLVGSVLGILSTLWITRHNRNQQKKLSLHDENEQLKQEIKAIKEMSTFKQSCVISQNGAYYTKKTDRGTEYFCSKCLDADNLAVHIHVYHKDKTYHCPKCDWNGELDDYVSSYELESQMDIKRFW